MITRTRIQKKISDLLGSGELTDCFEKLMLDMHKIKNDSFKNSLSLAFSMSMVFIQRFSSDRESVVDISTILKSTHIKPKEYVEFINKANYIYKYLYRKETYKMVCLMSLCIARDLRNFKPFRTKRFLNYAIQHELIIFDDETRERYEKLFIDYITKYILQLILATPIKEISDIESISSEAYHKLSVEKNVRHTVLTPLQRAYNFGSTLMESADQNAVKDGHYRFIRDIREEFDLNETLCSCVIAFCDVPEIYRSLIFFTIIYELAMEAVPFATGLTIKRRLDNIDTSDCKDEVIVNKNDYLQKLNIGETYMIANAGKFPPSVLSILRQSADLYINTPVTTSGSMKKLFRSLGMSESRSRDLSIIAGTLSAIQEQELNIPERNYDYLLDELDTLKDKDAEIEVPQRSDSTPDPTIETYKRQIRSLMKENLHLAHEIKIRDRKIDELASMYDEAISPPVISYENDPDTANDVSDTHSDDISAVEFPFHTEKNIVLLGGLDNFHSKLQDFIPNIRTIAVDKGNIDPLMLKGADAIFVLTKQCKHSMYWHIKTLAQNSSIPLFHLNTVNARQCAVFIAGKILNM